MKNKKSLWSLLILLLLIVGTFFYIFKGNNIKKILGAMTGIHWIYLIVGMLFMLIFVASEGLGIQVILRSFKYKHSFLKCLKYAFLGFYYCSVMPASSGQPVQIYYMNKDDIEVGDASLSIMIITIAYQIGVLIICIFALAMRFGFIMQNLGPVRYFSIYGALVNIGLVFLFVSATFHNKFVEKIISFLIKLLAKLRVVKDSAKAEEKAMVQLKRFRDGASYLKGHRKVLLVTLAAIVIKVLSRLSVAYAVYRAFGLHNFGYLDILSLQAFLTLGVEYLPIPGSVGVAEAGFYRVNGLIFGADRLMSATLLTRAISYYAYLIISGVVAITVYFKQTLRLHSEKFPAE